MKAVFKLLLVTLFVSTLQAAEMPVPIHNIQGSSGGFVTETAYIAKPAEDGSLFGRPSISATYAKLKNKDYEAFCYTQNVGGKFELGYSMERLGLGNWNKFVDQVSTIKTGGLITNVNTKHASIVHNFNVRYNIYKENIENPLWPSLTAGVHFKWNESVGTINRHLRFLGGAKSVGFDHNHGTEFTLTASKFIPCLIEGHPLMASIGLRNGDSIQKGLLGFAGERKTTLEANAFVFLTKKLVFGWEYKQENNLIGNKANSLVRDENDWWDICLAYMVNKDLTVAAGYANLGNILEESEDDVFAIQVKYNF